MPQPASAVAVPAAPSTSTRAYAALAVLTLINLLNYLDRYVTSGMLPLLKSEFSKSDAEMGVLSSSFLIVYSLVSPFTGVLGDRFPRKWFIGGGVLLWSGATVWSGLAGSFQELLFARALIGIGEAGYAAMAPSYISDLFDRRRRGQMLSFFYAALPIGSALGFAIGGWVGTHYGWRNAFHVAAAPGFLLGILALGMREPARGASDEGGAVTEKGSFLAGVGHTLRTLFTTPSYLVNTTGTTAMTFAMGGLAAWMPTFLNRERGVPLDEGGFKFSALLIIAGFAGTLVGGTLGDRIQARNRGGYFIVSGIGLLIGIPGSVLAAVSHAPSLYWSSIFVALFFLFFNTGPLNAALVNVVPATMRATAVALNVLVIHLLGDAFSPVLIGAISDRSSLGTAILVNAAVMGLAGLILLVGAGTLRRDMQRLEQGLSSLPHSSRA